MTLEASSGALRIVFRADDAGSCVSANMAIERVVREGPVRNVSVMACGPALQDAAHRLADLDVCIGLHVTLNAEWESAKWGPTAPTKAVPTLLEPGTGHFTDAPQVLHARGFVLDEAMLEVRAQLDALRRCGLVPAYLDEHMGVGWLPGLRERLELLAREEGLLFASALALRGLCDSQVDGRDVLERWVWALQSAPPGDYLVVAHPGLTRPDMEAFALSGQPRGEVARERQMETEALLSPALRAALSQRSAQSIRYDTMSM